MCLCTVATTTVCDGYECTEARVHMYLHSPITYRAVIISGHHHHHRWMCSHVPLARMRLPIECDTSIGSDDSIRQWIIINEYSTKFIHTFKSFNLWAHVKRNWSEEYEEDSIHFIVNHVARKQQIDVDISQFLCVVKCVTILRYY